MRFDWAAAEEALVEWIGLALPNVPVLRAYEARSHVTTWPVVIFLPRQFVTDGQSADVTSLAPSSPAPAFDEELIKSTRQSWVGTFPVVIETDPDATGCDAPDAMLLYALTLVGSPAVSDALAAAGLGLQKIGEVEGDPGIFSADYQPRAMAKLTIGIVEEATAKLGYIEHVEFTGDSIPGNALTVDLPTGP